MKKNNKEEDISIKVNQIEIKYINDPAYLTFLEFQGIDVKRINDPEYRTFLESKEIKFLTEDMLIETTKATKLKKEPEEAKKLEAQKLAKENLQAEKIEEQLRIQVEIEYLEQLVASGCVVRDDDSFTEVVHVLGYNPEF